ncbi:ParB/RepB/Spo0J family partition protein [Anaerolineales bacterium HSG6]|nr:ParB/RepB/Spo0J family partition protein [Anaerolineales bacterium HSG6]
MTKKRGLGKGLGALISTSTVTKPASSAGSIDVPTHQISPNPHQPRQSMDQTALQELADSITKHGLIQPLIVTQIGSTYQLIAGERRWRACQLAGIDEVPVIVKEATSQEMLELALVENIQRADLNPLEEATSYSQLISEFGLTQEAVSEQVGKSRTAVANTIRLLNLPNEAQQALITGKISSGHARALLSLKRTDHQLEVMAQVVNLGLTVRQTEQMVKQIIKGESIAPKPPPTKKSRWTPQDRNLVQQFESTLGTKVELSRTDDDRGKIVIHFYSDDDLQTIFDTILGQEDEL